MFNKSVKEMEKKWQNELNNDLNRMSDIFQGTENFLRVVRF